MRLWYTDAHSTRKGIRGRARDLETNAYVKRAEMRPEDERPDPHAPTEPPQPKAQPEPTPSTDPSPTWEPDPITHTAPLETTSEASDAPDLPPADHPPPGTDPGENGGPRAWSPEEAEQPPPEPEPEPEPAPSVDMRPLFRQLGVGHGYAQLVRFAADPKRKRNPAPILPNETEMYEDAIIAVLDHYLPNFEMGPLGQLAFVTAVGIAGARQRSTPKEDPEPDAPQERPPLEAVQ